MKNTYLLLLLCLTTLQCQYALDVPLDAPKTKKYLVLTADFTETYGRVAAEYSTEQTEPSKVPKVPTYLSGTAYVVDSKGNRTDFTLNGVKNTDFKGNVGERYQLFIETEGKKYQSKIETMLPCPKIDTVTTTFTTEPDRSLSNDDKYHGYDVRLETKDLPETGNYYQWEWTHYQRKLYCGLLVDTKTWNKEVKGVPCAEDCFVINFNEKLIVLSDELINGKPISIPIDRVPYAAPPEKYYLQIEQRAITKNAYLYLNALIKQTQTNGSQYDLPAQTLFSTNIECTTNPKEKVLGIFNVFSSYQKILIVDRGILVPNISRHFNVPPYQEYVLGIFEVFPFFPACGEETRYNTKKIPKGWKD
jgi:hypothetical protein